MRPRPSLPTLLARGLTKRCPRCGSAGLFHGWFRMVELCPGCRLRFEREEGHWLAASVINMGFTQTVVVVYLVLGLVLTWPDPPVLPLVLVGLGVTALAALLFFPLSKTLWQAIELWMRGSSAEDLEDLDRSTFR